MKQFTFFIIILFSKIIFSTENEKEINQKEIKNNNKSSNSIGNEKIYSLDDNTFDIVLQKGNYYKWFVILYSELCRHCEHARQELRKIFPEYKNSATIRFAEIEIDNNRMTDMRFDVEGVPYIFLLQNNSIYEMDLYPNEKNLKKFIETDFNEVSNELKSFPPEMKFYKVGWYIIRNIFRELSQGVNEILEIFGYKFRFTPLLIFFTFILTIIIFFTLEYFCCLRFCPLDESIKKIVEERKKKEKQKKNEDIEDEEIEKENENENKYNKEENKELAEEDKIEIEKKKETEKIEKEENKKNKEEKEKKLKKKKKE